MAYVPIIYRNNVHLLRPYHNVLSSVGYKSYGFLNSIDCYIIQQWDFHSLLCVYNLFSGLIIQLLKYTVSNSVVFHLNFYSLNIQSFPFSLKFTSENSHWWTIVLQSRFIPNEWCAVIFKQSHTNITSESVLITCKCLHVSWSPFYHNSLRTSDKCWNKFYHRNHTRAGRLQHKTHRKTDEILSRYTHRRLSWSPVYHCQSCM